LEEPGAHLQLQHSLLELFARKSSRREYLEEVVKLLCGWSDCACGGIRVLDEYGNIPYEAYRGFTREFWESESHLSLRHDQCACTRVISGKPDPQDLQVMTPGGSFHCNNTLEYIDQLSQAEKARFRGTCIQAGYASVAVVPVRYRGQVLGAIHLADRREGKLPRAKVELIESLTPLIGEAVHRFNLEEEVQRDREAQRVMNALLRLSLGEISPDELLRQGLELLLSVPWLSFEPRGAIYLAEGDPPVWRLKAHMGLSGELLESCAQLPPGWCVCGRAVEDLELHAGEARGAGIAEKGALGGGHSCIPLVSSEGVIGLAVLYGEDGFREEGKEEAFLRTAGGILAGTLRQKWAEEKIRSSEKDLRALSLQLLNAQEKERKRIAQELHDGVGQILAAIKFGVENVSQQMSGRLDPPVIKTLDSTVRMIQSAVEEVRKISTDLRPAILDDLGLLATVGWLIREFENIYSGITVERWMDVEEEEIPDSLKIVIYRVLQEALNNVAKHSRADRVFLSLKTSSEGIELAVEDQGVGFDLDNCRVGLGLGSMKERVELSGGRFLMESTQGKGTVIRAVWPI
jgi:signal transduction histidine kinase